MLQIRELLRPQLLHELGYLWNRKRLSFSPARREHRLLSPDVAIARPEHGIVETRPAQQVSAMVLEVDEEIELYESYSLLIRRAPDNRVVAAADILSPTNKGVFGLLDKEKYLRKRKAYFDAGINLLEIDSLLEEDRLLPPALESLRDFDRTAWTFCHAAGRRHFRSWGWSATAPLPCVEWEVEPGLSTVVDLALSCQRASEFNPWEMLVV